MGGKLLKWTLWSVAVSLAVILFEVVYFKVATQ